MGMEVQYRWTVKDYIKEKGLSGEEVYDRATRRRGQTSTPHQSTSNVRAKNNKKKGN